MRVCGLTYNVKGLLREGGNGIGIMLVTYADGSEEIIATGETWQAVCGSSAMVLLNYKKMLPFGAGCAAV